jgi:glucokinase
LKRLLEGIGIGAPNGNPFSGTIEYAPNLKWRGSNSFIGIGDRKIQNASVIITMQKRRQLAK